jgi:hypothetical protein
MKHIESIFYLDFVMTNNLFPNKPPAEIYLGREVVKKIA